MRAEARPAGERPRRRFFPDAAARRRDARPRWEVALPPGAAPAIPGGTCCACGGVASEEWSAAPLTPAGLDDRLPIHTFPLCHACGTARDTDDRFAFGGAAVAVAALLAAWAWLWTGRGSTGAWLLVLAGMMAASLFVLVLGVKAGEMAARLVGAVKPSARAGRRVTSAVAYRAEPDAAGLPAAPGRLLFRFTSEAYARAFAEANGTAVLPPGGERVVPAPPAAARP